MDAGCPSVSKASSRGVGRVLGALVVRGGARTEGLGGLVVGSVVGAVVSAVALIIGVSTAAVGRRLL